MRKKDTLRKIYFEKNTLWKNTIWEIQFWKVLVIAENISRPVVYGPETPTLCKSESLIDWRTNQPGSDPWTEVRIHPSIHPLTMYIFRKPRLKPFWFSPRRRGGGVTKQDWQNKWSWLCLSENMYFAWSILQTAVYLDVRAKILLWTIQPYIWGIFSPFHN